jgi:hypothetical protein
MKVTQSFVRTLLPYQLLDLFVRIFTVGIFSTTGGAKAWFELFLVIAALSSCGYLLWWQVIFLVLILIFGTLAAGLLTLIHPQTLTTQQFGSERFVVSTLDGISRAKIQEVSYLSGDALTKHKSTLLKAAKILQDHPTLLDDLTQLKTTLQNIGQDYRTTQEKIQVEEEEAKEVERQKQANEQRRRIQLAELEEQRKEADRKKQQQLAEQAKKKEEFERQEAINLQRQRREAGFSGGHPPLQRYGPSVCPHGYPIKVTLNGTSDGFDGVIWKPEDGKQYDELKNLAWCFRSVEEAKSDIGRYRLTRPRNNKGYERP